MKWQTLAVAFAGLTAAHPLTASARDNGLEVYKLRISSRDKSLNGRYLSTKSINANVTEIGLFDDAPDVQVYTVTSHDTGLVELHTYPVGFVDHALAMVGSQGLLNFRDVVNPAGSTFPSGTTCDWKKFSFKDGPASNGTSVNTLTYAGSNGQWVAFPSGREEWTVKWKGSDAWTTEDYMPIYIVYETNTTKGSYNPGSSD